MGDEERGGVDATAWHRLTHEPRRPRWVRESGFSAWLAVGTVCIGAFMGQLDASIVTQALPTLSRSLHTSVAATEWVALTYLLVLVGLLPVMGRLADMVGRKLLYSYGFLVFIGASLLCALSPTLPALVAARALQGVGAAMLQSNSLAIIVNAAPAGRLPRAIGIQGAAQALGLALGPAVGGLLIGLGGWRLIFFVNIPVGLLGTLLATLLIPRSRHLAPRLRLDWAGVGLVAAAAAVLMVALSLSASAGLNRIVGGCFLAAAALCALLVRRERTAEHPLIPASLFSRTAFTLGIATGLLSYLVLFGILFVVPFLLEVGLHSSAASAGLHLILMPLALGCTAPLAGRLSERLGPRPLTVAGMLLTALGLGLTALTVGNLPALALGLVLMGVGLGAFTPANNAAIMGSVPPQQTGVASGVLNMTRGLGTGLGLAITSLVYVAASGGASSADSLHGFMTAAWTLAAIALIAALIASGRGNSHAPGDTAALPG